MYAIGPSTIDWTLAFMMLHSVLSVLSCTSFMLTRALFNSLLSQWCQTSYKAPHGLHNCFAAPRFPKAMQRLVQRLSLRFSTVVFETLSTYFGLRLDSCTVVMSKQNTSNMADSSNTCWLMTHLLPNRKMAGSFKAQACHLAPAESCSFLILLWWDVQCQEVLWVLCLRTKRMSRLRLKLWILVQ